MPNLGGIGRALLATSLIVPCSAQDLVTDLYGYLDALTAWRESTSDSPAELLERGEALCEQYARCDALEVARFYATLDRESRLQGVLDGARVDALRDEWVDAGHDGLPFGVSWEELSAQLEGQLSDLVQELNGRADPAPAARAHALLARLLVSTDVQRAELHVETSIAAFTRCGMVTPRLEPLWVRGQLARARRDRHAARQDQLECLELARTVSNAEYEERALLALVELARDVGHHAEVDQHLRELAKVTTPAESWPLAREHAASLLASDRAEAALAFLTANPPGAEAHQDPWRALTAACYLRTGDLDGARRQVARLAGGTSTSRLARAALALAEGEPQRALDDLEGTPFPGAKEQAEAHVIAAEAWLALDRPERAHLELEDALAIARDWDDGSASGGSVTGEWLGLHAIALAAEVRARLGDPLGAAALIEDVQAQTLRPESTLGPAEIQEWAARFEGGLITWSVGADSTVCAWVNADGSGDVETLPYGRRAWRQAIRRVREAAIAGNKTKARALGEEIGQALFPARWREQERAEDDRVLLCLHGPLEALPVTLCAWDGASVDERFTAVVLPGLPHGDGASGDQGWHLLGAPQDHLATLDAAAVELAHLATVYPDAPLASGAAFRRGAFFEALASGRSLHLATHLVHDANCDSARLSPVGLALSAGEVVCADEILAAGCAAPLVVLTVCETAGGRMVDGEGAQGVARALLEAGAGNVLVTLWPVEDEAARAYGLAFHEALAKDPSPSRAARAARLELRRAGHSPAAWAVFRALGRN